MQLECKAYIKARDRFREKQEDEDDKDKGKAKGSAYYVRLINPYDEGLLS